MSKKQYITIGVFAIFLTAIYLFSNTTKPKENSSKEPSPAMASGGSFDFKNYLEQTNSSLDADTLSLINSLVNKADEPSIVDSIGAIYTACNHPEVAAYYQYKLAEKKNTDILWAMAGEKNYLAGVLTTTAEELRAYLFFQAINAFKKAVALKPANETYKVKLATCYMDGTQEVMTGVSMLKEIIQRDSNNVDAQFTLGRFGIVSGQFDKSIVRLEKVISLQPANADAYLLVAEAYEKTGDIEKAIKALEKGRLLVQDPDFKKEIAKYIEDLKNKK